MADQQQANGNLRASPEPIPGAASPSSPPPTTRKAGTRSRSSSLQKGAAVLRALSRAESDFDLDLSAAAQGKTADLSSSSGSATPDGQVSSSVQASDASGLRSRLSATAPAANKSVAKPSKKRSKSSSGSASAAKKSWEIPRKIFHSSIGGIVVYLYLSNADLHIIVRNLTYFLGVVVTADVIRLNNPSFELLYEKVLGFLMRESEKEKVNGVVWYLIGVITSLHFFPEDIACVSIMILSWCDTCASTFGRLFGRYTPPLPSPPFARRKSLAGFLAAIVSGALTSYFFWCTSIAARGERPNGISWSGSGLAHPAIFGTARASGITGTGWQGWSSGFAGQSGSGLEPNLFSAPYLTPDSVASGKLGSDAIRDVPGMPWWLLTIGSGLVAAIAEGLELGGVDDNLSLPILSATGIWAMLYAWGRAASSWFA